MSPSRRWKARCGTGWPREELLRPGVDVRAFVEAKSYFPAYVPVVTDPGFFDN